MATIVLKDSDMNRMRKINAQNGYGMDCRMMNDTIDTYQNYRKYGFDYQCALIEYQLTDINFHHEVGLLKAGKYNELREEVKQW